MKFLISLSLLSLSLQSFAQNDCRLSITYLERTLLNETQMEEVQSDFRRQGFELISQRNLIPGDFILDGVFRMESRSLADLDSMENSSVIMGQGYLLALKTDSATEHIKTIPYTLRKTPENKLRVLSSLSNRLPRCSNLLKKVSQ